jgi:hypothetical protein
MPWGNLQWLVKEKGFGVPGFISYGILFFLTNSRS